MSLSTVNYVLIPKNYKNVKNEDKKHWHEVQIIWLITPHPFTCTHAKESDDPSFDWIGKADSYSFKIQETSLLIVWWLWQLTSNPNPFCGVSWGQKKLVGVFKSHDKQQKVFTWILVYMWQIKVFHSLGRGLTSVFSQKYYSNRDPNKVRTLLLVAHMVSWNSAII